MTKRAALLLLAALATAASVVTPASPAHADSGAISVADGVLYECAELTYSYSLDLPGDTEDWNMDVTVRSEDGLEAATDYVYDQVGTAGTSEFTLCPSDGPGTYSASAVVAYYDQDYDRTEFELPVVHFDMRLPMTRTSLTAKVTKVQSKRIKTILLRTSTRDERPNGYYPTSYPHVIVQQKQGLTWRTLPNLDLNVGGDGKGLARFKWPLGKRAVLRAATIPEDWNDYTGSVSASVKIR